MQPPYFVWIKTIAMWLQCLSSGFRDNPQATWKILATLDSWEGATSFSTDTIVNSPLPLLSLPPGSAQDPPALLSLAACPAGTFKASQGSGLCVPCPPNSRSSSEASAVCACRNGYYRADFDPPAAACTSEYGVRAGGCRGRVSIHVQVVLFSPPVLLWMAVRAWLGGQGGGMAWLHILPYWQPLEFIHHPGSGDGREIVPRIN